MFYTGKLLHVNDMFDMFVNIFNRSKTSCGQISINKQLGYEGILDIVVLCRRRSFCLSEKTIFTYIQRFY